MGKDINISSVVEKDGKYIFDSKEVKVEVGDTKQVSFYPQIKMMKWDNEVNFSLRYTSDIADSNVNKDNKDIITWIGKDNVKVRIYEKEDSFELEFELPEKPDTNIFDMSIQTKDLVFYHQPEISDEEAQELIDRYKWAAEKYPEAEKYIPTSLEEAKRRKRPENVVGSYAVYHVSKRDNQYKTGKAFHIFRPKAIDKDGKETWCDLSIDTKTDILSVIIPQEFLDKAVYPVTVDPEIGHNGFGGSTDILANNGTNYQMGAVKPDIANNIIIDTISCLTDSTDSSYNIKMGIYSPFPPNGPPTPTHCPRITNGQSPEISTGIGSKQTCKSTYLNKPSLIAGGNYALAVAGNYYDTKLYYDSGTSTGYNFADSADSTYSDITEIQGQAARNDRIYDIWATYTPNIFNVNVVFFS